jgi:hypothetical protein
MKKFLKLAAFAILLGLFACGSGANQQEKDAAAEEAPAYELQERGVNNEQDEAAGDQELQLQKPIEEKEAQQEPGLQLQSDNERSKEGEKLNQRGKED